MITTAPHSPARRPALRVRLTEFSLLEDMEPSAPAPATTTDPDAADAPPAGASTARWSGVLAVEGVRTGDGRVLAPGSIRWELDGPLPSLRYVDRDTGGHDNAQVVGSIAQVTRGDDGRLNASGPLDLGSEVGREAYRQIKGGYTTGVSVDLDDMSFEYRVSDEALESADDSPLGLLLADAGEPVDTSDGGGYTAVGDGNIDDELFVVTSARLRGATIVAIPAFAEAFISIAGTDADDTDADAAYEGSLASAPASGAKSKKGKPGAPSGGDDNGEDDDSENGSGGAAPGSDGDADGAAPSDSAPAAPSDGDSDSGDGDNGSGDDENDEDEDAPKKRPPFPPAKKGKAAASPLTLDEVVASAAPVAPPVGWFRDPQLSGPTPLEVTEDGRVFGHLATWSTCHTAREDVCVTPPSSPSGYARFHVGSLRTAEGDTISVGHLTMGTGHAAGGASPQAAAAHYDNTGSAVADVRAGEDAFGIWVAGALRPGVTPEQVRTLRSSPLSGDWRRVDGALELYAALAVNVPGFPVPRTAGLVASGELESLVASGLVPPRRVARPGTPGALSAGDLRYLKNLAARERRAEAASLAAHVHSIENRRKVLAFAAKRKDK